ncbi:MAG: hypothetical protein H0W99_17995 [Acidobacteria bacterium]|nr:hypothetical protein [Acidobacteriota bacterium]
MKRADKTGETLAVSLTDILIVAPYNAQMSALRDMLPGARVGTVDKNYYDYVFQSAEQFTNLRANLL